MAALSRRRLTYLVLPMAILLTLAACSTDPRKGTSLREGLSSSLSSASGGRIIHWVVPPEDATEADKKAAEEAVSLFKIPCLEKFPDDDAVAGYAAEQTLAPMSEAEIHRLLGTDPGIGWTGQVPESHYLLTIEKPPYHTCAIRVVFAGPPKAVRSYFFLSIAVWATLLKNNILTEEPPQSTTMDGRPTQVYSYLLTDAEGRTPEHFYVFVTAAPDGRREVRLVRQIHTG